MIRLDALTWPEVQEYLNGKDDLIVPVGTCEQHSKHLPLNTDNLIAEYFCNYLSDETGTLIAPTINYGVNLPCDRIFQGTANVPMTTLKNYFLSIIKWWSLQGFKRYYVISGHGDPFHVKAYNEISKYNVDFLELFDLDLQDILTKQNGLKHACEGETSVMLHLFPERVRTNLIEDFETPINEFLPYLHHKKRSPIPNSPGCQGFPSFATEEKGRKIVDRVKKQIIKWYSAKKNT